MASSTALTGADLGRLEAADLDDLKLFHSPVGLFKFQAEGAAEAINRASSILVYSPGLGKTIVSLAMAAYLYERDLIDLVVVLAETDKLGDWQRDRKRFTELSSVIYHGTPKKREKIHSQPLPQVAITTYETLRNDAVVWGKSKWADPTPGVLLELLESLPHPSHRPRRILFVKDEAGKVRTRTSKNHRALDYVCRRLRSLPGFQIMVTALTATPIERGPEDQYNIARIVNPEVAGTVEQFEQDHVVLRDAFGRVMKFKNLTAADHYEPWVTTLEDKLAPLIIRKSKRDPDVREQFPRMVEEIEYVSLGGKQASFYQVVSEVYADASALEQAQSFGVLRKIAGHPLSLLSSKGIIAREIVAEVGPKGLQALGAAKLDRLVALLSDATAEGSQAVVFTFYGPSMGPLLVEGITAAGMSAVLATGAQSRETKEENRAAFKAGEVQVLVASDASSRGLNLQNASYVFHYDLPVLASTYRQRSDRIHRIDSEHESVTVVSMIATLRNATTVEDGIANLCLRREGWSDAMIGADGTLDAKTRKRILTMKKREADLSDALVAFREV